MRNRARVCTAVAAVLLGVATQARGQAAPDAWQVTVAPYLMAAGMNGTAGIGRLESDVNMSAGDIFSNLQFGFMGYFEARKEKWGVGADIIWMALGTSTDDPVPANVDVNQGGFTFVALRELSPAVDLRAGVVINTLQTKIKFKDPIDREVARDDTWVDPMVGLNIHTPDRARKWRFGIVADVGGFGVGSDFMLNLEPTALVRVTPTASLAFGYRVIYINYENDGDDTQRRFLYDVTSSGPFAGFVFRF